MLNLPPNPQFCQTDVRRSFSLEQYRQMAERFNKMSFREKILTIQKNNDILTLASDGNWWGVKVKDIEMQEQLYYNEWQFNDLT
jgi:hypothetical protein